MEPFPDEHELIGLFESEPTLADAGIPWRYNRLRFTRTIGINRIECDIEPGYETLLFRWIQNNIEIVNLDLRWVCGLTVECESAREVLVAHFRASEGVNPLIIQFAPAIHISWGTNQNLV